MNQTHNVRHAGSDFLNFNDLQQQTDHFRNNEKIITLLDAIPDRTVILNPQRQIIFANRKTHEKYGDEDMPLTGKSPGELLHCVNCANEPWRCGTTSQCIFCGMNQAFIQSRKNRHSERDCTINTVTRENCLLRVWGIPHLENSILYSMMIIRDIQNATDQAMLEKFLLTDVREKVTRLEQTLARQVSARLSSESILEEARQINSELSEAINDQLEMREAENDTLRTAMAGVCALRELQNIVKKIMPWLKEEKKRIVITADSERVAIQTDPTLLRRVLSDMLKNALSSVMAEEQITVACRRTGNLVEYSVSSNGCLSEEQQTQLFQRNYNLSGHARSPGLYCARLLAEKYLCGQMICKSGTARGTSVKLSLPTIRRQFAAKF